MQLTPRLAATALCLLALAACDKPKSRASNDQGGPLGASGETTVAGPAAPAAAPAPPPKPTTTTDPLPDLPKWAKSLMGQKLADAYPNQTAGCLGNTDLVGMRYQGAAAPGTRVEGWGWDPAIKAPVARVLLVGDNGQIVGAGETGLPRPDVAAARKDITSPTTGWQAFTPQGGGGLYAYGLTADGKLRRTT